MDSRILVSCFFMFGCSRRTSSKNFSLLIRKYFSNVGSSSANISWTNWWNAPRSFLFPIHSLVQIFLSLPVVFSSSASSKAKTNFLLRCDCASAIVYIRASATQRNTDCAFLYVIPYALTPSKVTNPPKIESALFCVLTPSKVRNRPQIESPTIFACWRHWNWRSLPNRILRGVCSWRHLHRDIKLHRFFE